MTKETNKFHALQLFTDTFTAETVHLTNEQVGIYIRLLSFAWTKNTKPFNTQSAYRICQCVDSECKKKVQSVLREFFILTDDVDSLWTHKRLVKEHAYLVDKYQRRSEAGKKGGLAKRDNATSKNVAPSPIPSPSPNNNIYDQDFEQLWTLLHKKRGSKYKAYQIWLKNYDIISVITSEKTAKIYNNSIKDIEDIKFIPHFATWLSQRRWETEDDNNPIPDLIDRMVNLGYIHNGQDGNFELFEKDGKKYKMDIFDEKHQIQLVQ
tara:strand:- start:862 stop:1656 length:795 start_codon:yes stop_codon:yes gene_type:complete